MEGECATRYLRANKPGAFVLVYAVLSGRACALLEGHFVDLTGRRGTHFRNITALLLRTF